MLIQLKLNNIALIEIIEINFEKGLNVLTGDSGSGKSLILDSLNVLFGGTNIPLNHLIRPGKNNCSIEAKFHSSTKVKNWLNNHGFHNTLSAIKVNRISYKKNNKVLTKYSLNDLSINKKKLQELGSLLIDFAGQSDTFLFESLEYRRQIIDDLGSKKLRTINLNIKKEWGKYEILKRELIEKKASLKKQQENNLAIKEMFSILDKANLNSCDEILELESKENRLANNFEINKSIQEVLQNLNFYSTEEPSVGSLISQSIKCINKVSEFDIKIQEFRESLISIQNDLENLTFEISSYLEQFENGDINLEDIQKRLFFLKNLERTFLLELPELIQRRDQLKSNLFHNIENSDIKNLEDDINILQNNLNSLFKIQSVERKLIANKLQHSVMSLLKDLGMKDANFSITFDKVIPSENGIDNIRFLFSANPDQKLAPISKVISGGEMSRFLLAFKSSISKKPNTFFLDEIDNGLSGKSLYALVELIKKISIEKQVLCITHQPYLAASGKTHFKVKKNVINGITYTFISNLITKKERQNELIELIGAGLGGVDDYASILLERAAA